jgi:hypothetical protein
MSKQLKAIYETIADIAYIAGAHGYYSGDSRADMSEFVFLAQKFEEKFAMVDWDESDADYIIEIDTFTRENLRLRKKLDFTPAAATTPWDSFEVSPVREEPDGCEVCDKGEEDFWSVYLHQVEGGVACIADLPSEEHAEAIKQLLENAVKSFHQNASFAGDIARPNRDAIVMAVLYLRNYANTFKESQSGYQNIHELANELEALQDGEEPINPDPVI